MAAANASRRQRRCHRIALRLVLVLLSVGRPHKAQRLHGVRQQWLQLRM
jgi:hypothetical protein